MAKIFEIIGLALGIHLKYMIGGPFLFISYRFNFKHVNEYGGTLKPLQGKKEKIGIFFLTN